MKWLFIMLLGLNVLLLLYVFSGDQGPSVAGSAPPMDEFNARIDAEKMKTVVIPQPEEKKPLELKFCYSLGPFDQSLHADRVKGDLSEIGIKSTRRNSQKKLKDNYWVYLSPSASRAAAIKLSRELKDRGIAGNFVISTGSNKNAISLGLYTSKEKAKQRYQQLVEIGYEPLMETRPMTQTRYWLDVLNDNVPEEEAMDNIKTGISPFPEVRVKKRDC